MFMGMENGLVYETYKMGEERIRVEVYYRSGEFIKEMVGLLYFEKAKRSFNRKPVGMDKWVCVDAKVEGLYSKDESITPPQIISKCYEKIKEMG